MTLGDTILENLHALGVWLMRPRGLAVKILAILAIVVALPLAAFALLPAALEYFAPPLDTSQDLYAVNRPIAFTFLDAEGRTAGHRGAIVGDRLKLEDMPSYLPAAFVAMEDRRFYSHSGIDMRGLLRALWLNWRAGHVVAGGSTITQQTAKIVFLNPERTYARKFQELLDAESLEKSLSKKQILELYLNRIYLGSGAYGVDGAAHVYFGKSARDLSIAEAAMLATLTTAPSVFSPRRDLARAQTRANRVLAALVRTHAITKAQARAAKNHPAVVSDRSIADARNFYLDTAADEAVRVASINGKPPSGDLVVHTTLQPAIEENARHALVHLLAKSGRKARASEGAVILMKPDGAVTALIGGKDYDSSVFNRATQARRQPGSAFKPFVYLAALENGISPWDQRSDGPVDIDGWQPTNYGNRSFGTITLASALAHSVNTITAALAQEVGVTSVIDAAQRLGINSPMAANASIALGTSELTPLELTTAYAAIANGGYRVYPYFVTEVDDSQGHLLYKRETPAPKRVIAGHVDRDLVAMLYGVIQEGTGRSAMLPGHEAAGKTGTTQDYHDAWFVGFTTDYVCSVWLGNDDSSPMRNVTGGTLPASLWKSVMTYAEKDLPGKPLDKSAPEAPTDENGIITAESGSASVESANGEAATTDEEAGGEVSSEANASGNGSDSNSKENKSWWDWLFGHADNPQIRQPAQSGQAQEAHAHSDTSAPPAREHTDDNNGSAADSNSSGNSDEDNSGDNSDDTGDTPPTHQQHAWRTYSQQRALAAQSWRLRTRQAYAPTGRGYPPGSWQAYGWMQERSGDAQRMRDSEQQRAREYERQRAREYPPPQYAWRGEDSPDDAYGPPPPRYPRATRRSPRDEDDYGDEPGDYPER